MKAQRASSEHKLQQLPLQVIRLVGWKGFVEERLEQTLGDALEFEVIVDVQGVRLEIQLNCLVDATLLKVFVAARR